MEAEIKSLRIAVAAADEAAAHAFEEATTETTELVTLRTRLAEASSTAERQNELLEAQGEELSHFRHAVSQHESQLAALRQREAAACAATQEATDRATAAEKRCQETEERAESLAEQHAVRESEYKSRVETMRERMGLFEDTIKELQAHCRPLLRALKR